MGGHASIEEEKQRANYHTKIKVTVVLVAVAVLVWSISPSTAFVPTRFLAYLLNGVSFSFDSTITHKDMSRAAVLQVAAEVLTDNPENEGSVARIAALTSLTESDLVSAYYGEQRRGQTRSFSDAIDAINDANADVDLGEEQELAAAHFDSEQFQAGQNRLVELRQTIVTHISMLNFEMARMETGRMFHTLQDFYSHSNWIENGNRVPYDVLGRDGARPSNIAGPATQTCTDCERDGSIFVASILNTVLDVSSTQYSCSDNLVGKLRKERILTSGYHVHQRDLQGREIEKPTGKCSHGGFRDTTADFPAIGSINKDSPFEEWSPHHELYRQAASVAQDATASILRQIRQDVDNDQLFSVYLGLDVPRAISITYVIDTTGSMGEELPQIQATIPTIRTSLRNYVESFAGSISVNYILVPFNDPGIHKNYTAVE